MIHCAKCGYENSEDDGFCQECGAALVKKASASRRQVESPPQTGAVSRIEQAIYFKVARGFAWLVILFAGISIIYYIVNIIPTAIDSIGGSTNVTGDEIKKAIESRKSRGWFASDEESEEKIDPELMSKLDKHIYELSSLLPGETQKRLGGIEGLRNHIKSNLNHWKNLKEQINVAQEATVIIKDFPETGRIEALERFFAIKAKKENMVKAKQAKAKDALEKNILQMLMAIATSAFVTMILVLLTIERNTRKAA